MKAPKPHHFQIGPRKYVARAGIQATGMGSFITFSAASIEGKREVLLRECNLTWESPWPADSKEMAALIKKGLAKLESGVRQAQSRNGTVLSR
jgi:hypothetical protein